LHRPGDNLGGCCSEAKRALFPGRCILSQERMGEGGQGIASREQTVEQAI
jgi:hypothetical protein